MTDFVDNEMKVYGKRKDLETFKEDVAEGNDVFSFNKIIPMAEDLSSWDIDGDGRGWYYWQVEHWGVKGGAYDTFLTDMNKYLFYFFDSPWSPPKQIFETLIDRYPALSFEIITYEHLTDGLLLQMKSDNGNLTEFKLFCSEFKRSGNNIVSFDYEYDVLTNKAILLKEAPDRIFKPLE